MAETVEQETERLKEYIIHLQDINESLNAQIEQTNFKITSTEEQNETEIQRMLGFIEDQTLTIENQKQEIKDSNHRNQTLAQENKKLFDQLVSIENLTSQKDNLIEELQYFQTNQKKEETRRNSFLQSHLEQENQFLKYTTDQQSLEIEQLKSQLEGLEYQLNKLKGKQKIGSVVNKSFVKNSKNNDQKRQIDLTKNQLLKKTATHEGGAIFRKRSPQKASNQVFANELLSPMDYQKNPEYELYRKSSIQQNLQILTEDEQLDGNEFLKSLDFRNVTFNQAEEEADRMTRLSPRSIQDYTYDFRHLSSVLLDEGTGEEAKEVARKRFYEERRIKLPKVQSMEIGCQSETDFPPFINQSEQNLLKHSQNETNKKENQNLKKPSSSFVVRVINGVFVLFITISATVVNKIVSKVYSSKAI